MTQVTSMLSSVCKYCCWPGEGISSCALRSGQMGNEEAMSGKLVIMAMYESAVTQMRVDDGLSEEFL